MVESPTIAGYRMLNDDGGSSLCFDGTGITFNFGYWPWLLMFI